MAGGQGDDRGWDGWMASLIQWTWVCIASGSLWWTGKPSVLQSMGLQWVRHHWATELTDCPIQKSPFQGKLPQNMFDNLKRISLKYWHAFHLQFNLETSEKPLQGTHVRWATVQRLSLVTHKWLSRSVKANFFGSHGLQTRLLSPWDIPGKNTGEGCLSNSRGIFSTQGRNSYLMCFLHWKVGFFPLHQLDIDGWNSVPTPLFLLLSTSFILGNDLSETPLENLCNIIRDSSQSCWSFLVMWVFM